MSMIDQFFTGAPIVLEGTLIKKTKTEIHFQIQPGLMVEVDRKHCLAFEEGKDEVTGRTFVRITLSPDCEVTSVFKPKLARLASSMQGEGVPFSVGGDPITGGTMGDISAFSSRTPNPLPQSFKPPHLTQPTMGDITTYSIRHFYGRIADDIVRSDWDPDPPQQY